MRPSRRLGLLTAAAVGAATLAALPASAQASPAGPPGPSGSSAKVEIPHTLPRWVARAHRVVTPMFAARSGMTAQVYLAPRGGLDALKAKVAALSDPASPEYRHWLTTAQYEAAFEPTPAAVAAVSRYLTGQGLSVTGVEAHRRYVQVSGSQAALSAAFDAHLATFAHNGQTVTAPTTPATLPAAVAGQVLTVTGLDTTQVPMHHSATPPPGFNNARPCSITYGQIPATYQADYKTPLPKFQGRTLPYAVCGYTGPALRSAYEGNTPLTGAGVTVAITDAYAWQKIASDANTYAVNNGDPAYRTGQLVQSHPARFTHQAVCGPSGWSTEETLDVEAVHAMAPDANIRYYAAASCYDTDFLNALTRAVDDNVAKVITNSWGEAEQFENSALINAYEQILLQGAAQGQSFLWSSGDNGDELANTGIKQADYPASDPYVTAVGGTATAIANGQVAFNAGWGTDKYSLSSTGASWTPVGFMYGSGGGYSSLFNRPAYQNGVVPASAPPGRAVPDVAMDADPTTGMLIGQTQTFPDGVHYGQFRLGGTSLASPLFAGMTALAIQHGGGAGLGLLNPKIYAASKTQFTDVRPVGAKGNVRPDYKNGVDPSAGIVYSVRTFGQDSSLPVTAGWDAVTGVGVPNAAYLTSTTAPASSSGRRSQGQFGPGHGVQGSPQR